MPGLPIIYELPPGELPRQLLSDAWAWLREQYPGECGGVHETRPDPAGFYRLTLEVPLREGAYLLALDALTQINLWARRRLRLPSVYTGGLSWVEEPPGLEVWASSPALYARGYGDCEDLAADRAAELQLNGVGARAVIRFVGRDPNGSDHWHVVVRHPDGRIEDPSLSLGMT